jgi:hypothetical protein
MAMLRVLALCKRLPPESGHIDQQGEHPPLTREGEGAYTLAIVPWSDQATVTNPVQADRVLHATQLEELTHAF